MSKFKFLCAAAAFAMPVAGYAQQITTEIQGVVTDQAGAPLAGATVVVADTRTGSERSFTTDASGTFAARGLTTGGPYIVTATASGFQGQTVENITTTLQGATSLTFSLQSADGGAGETIVVTGTRARLTQLEIGPGRSFGPEVLESIPTFNRDIRDVIRLDPRVSLTRDDLSGQDRISCLGGNDRGNTFTVDGIVQGDVYGLNDTGFSSRSSTPIPYDAVRETQVQFAPMDVEYGQFTGCSVNVVTRSGSNRFRGGGFYEYTNNDLRGETYAGNRPAAAIDPERRWGVSLGGPILRDRLFFFGAYEHHKGSRPQEFGPSGTTGAQFATPIPAVTEANFNQIAETLRTIYGIDTGPLVYSRPFQNDRYFGRLDWQIDEDHRAEFTFQRLEESEVRSDDFFTGATPQVTGQNTFLRSGTNSDYYSGRLYSQWTDRFSTELRYSHSKVIDVQDPIGGGEAQSANPIPRIVVGVENVVGGQTLRGTVLAGPGNNRSANDLQTTIRQFKAVANLDLEAHNFKFGVEANHVNLFNLFVANATGTLVFRNLADLQAGLLSPGTTGTTSTLPNNVVGGQTVGAFGAVSATGDVNDAAAQFTRTIYSAYLQDDWQATDQLSIVAGIRTDWYSGGRPENNPNFQRRFGITNSTGFSDLDPVLLPRLGFTYDINDFAVLSRAQLRGGVGLFSGGDPLVWYGNAFQNDGSTFAVANTGNAACNSAKLPNGQIDVVVNGQFTGVPQCFRGAAQGIAAAGMGATQSIDPDIKVPTVLRANLGLQSELNFADSGLLSGWRINLDYIYSRYRNQYTVVDLAQTLDTRRGLAGRTIDLRPIYAPIDPLRAGCSATLVDAGSPPVWQNVTAPCFNTNVSTGSTLDTNRVGEYMLTNSGEYDSQIISFLLSKDFDRGIFTPGGSVRFDFGYAFIDSQDRRNLYNSTAGSNYGITAAFDRQNPDVSRGFYETRHNFSLNANFKEQFFGDYDTSFGFRFGVQSGRPYSLTFAGNSVFGPSQAGSDNALLYVPTGASDPNVSPLSNATAVQQLTDYLNGLDCAKKYSGRTIARNTCTNDTYTDLDLTFSQELPGPGRFFGVEDRIRLYATFDNFLNLLNSSWNTFRRRDFGGRQAVATLGSATAGGTTFNGVDAQGRYIISGFRGATTIANENEPKESSSLWRLKVGVSYKF